VARVCQVAPATVAHWIDQGHLKGHRTPTGRRRVATEDLLQFLESHDMAVPAELEAGPFVVVVVEDEERYRRALAQAIARSDLDVELVEAATGTDGLLEIGRHEPQLVVLDYGLPDFNAEQVVERLLAPGRGLAVQVLVVTGGLPEEADRHLRELGVRGIVNKMDGLAAVVEAMREALPARRGQAA
jgi:CheY-like chemotaxis protein